MKKREHRDMIRRAWDAYQPDYMAFHLKEWPDFYERLAGGAVMLDDCVVEMLGDVAGSELLDVCCACDAKQAFSWVNLGARVTACDISPAAVDIATKNADRVGLPVAFHVADAQTLRPIPSESFDIVFASYIVWFEDIFLACRNWFRVLRPAGRLLMDIHHPVTYWLREQQGALVPEERYHRSGPLYYEFTGTDLADRHGGWGNSFPCVEFHHTLAQIVNAVIQAGFRLTRVREVSREQEGPLGMLPNCLLLLWQKPAD